MWLVTRIQRILGTIGEEGLGQLCVLIEPEGPAEVIGEHLNIRFLQPWSTLPSPDLTALAGEVPRGGVVPAVHLARVPGSC